MRRLHTLLALLLALLPLAPFRTPPPAAAAGRCFMETGRCAEGAFFDFWQTHGALEILGLPISQPFVDDRKLIVQYYERAILEWHPEQPPQYQVLLSLLGATRLGQRPERSAPPQPCLPPNCAAFAETRHTLRGTFLHYWMANGGLAVFGFPLTEEFTETNPGDGKVYTVQYFERNRFEYHPEHAGTRYEVLLGLLGAEALRAQPALTSKPTVAVPDYTRIVGTPQRLVIPAISVDAPVEPVGVDATNTMETPRDPFAVAWYAPGSRPGQRGNAVIAGHVDFAGVGPAVFWEVRLLTPGAELWVVDDAGARWRFVVQAVESYPLAQFPGLRVFGPTDDTNLNLISCVGDFDPVTASYSARVVVYARWDGVVPQPTQ